MGLRACDVGHRNWNLVRRPNVWLVLEHVVEKPAPAVGFEAAPTMAQVLTQGTPPMFTSCDVFKTRRKLSAHTE